MIKFIYGQYKLNIEAKLIIACSFNICFWHSYYSQNTKHQLNV